MANHGWTAHGERRNDGFEILDGDLRIEGSVLRMTMPPQVECDHSMPADQELDQDLHVMEVPTKSVDQDDRWSRSTVIASRESNSLCPFDKTLQIGDGHLSFPRRLIATGDCTKTESLPFSESYHRPSAAPGHLGGEAAPPIAGVPPP
jgi:hypothetical protein